MFPTFISSKIYSKIFIFILFVIFNVLTADSPPPQHPTNIPLTKQTITTNKPIPFNSTATTPPTTIKITTKTSPTTPTSTTPKMTTTIKKVQQQQKQQFYHPKNNQQQQKKMHRRIGLTLQNYEPEGHGNYEERQNYYEREYPKYNKREEYYGSEEKEKEEYYGGGGENYYKEGYQHKEYPSHYGYNNERNYEQYGGSYEKEYYPEEKKPYAPEGNYNYEKESEYNNNGEYEQQSYSGTSPWSFEHNKRHSYDSHYCSVHGSFSLALASTGYSNAYNYEKEYDQNYSPPQPRYHTRQFCRFTAATSQKACHFCCRIVARSANTSPDDIVSAIFKFDPAYPSANGAGIGGGYEKTSYTSTSLFQCVCCAPKQKY